MTKAFDFSSFVSGLANSEGLVPSELEADSPPSPHLPHSCIESLEPAPLLGSTLSTPSTPQKHIPPDGGAREVRTQADHRARFLPGEDAGEWQRVSDAVCDFLQCDDHDRVAMQARLLAADPSWLQALADLAEAYGLMGGGFFQGGCGKGNASPATALAATY